MRRIKAPRRERVAITLPMPLFDPVVLIITKTEDR